MKNEMKTKITALLLLIVACLSVFSCSEEPETFVEGDFKYTLLSDGTYSVGVADKENLPAEITLPTSYNGAAVSAITGGGFGWCTTLEKVTVPEGFTEIPSTAFYECTALTEIYLPSSLTYINGMTFCKSGENDELTIRYNGSKLDWAKLKKNDKWDYKVDVTVICNNGTIS